MIEKGKEFLLIALLVLLIVHLISPKNFPFQPNYTFPLRDFLVNFTGTYLLWQILGWNYTRYYKPAVIKGNFSGALIVKTVMVSVAIAFVFYVAYVPLVLAFVYNQPLRLYNMVLGVSVSMSSVGLIILIYLGTDLYRLWKQVQSTPAATEDAELMAPSLEDQAGAVTGSAPLLQQIVIHTGRETLQLPLQQIGYFVSRHKMVFAMLHSGKRLTTHFILSELEKVLPQGEFFRVSRQVIVSKPAVLSVKKDTNNKLLLQIAVNGQEPEEVVISRYKAAEFKKWFSPED